MKPFLKKAWNDLNVVIVSGIIGFVFGVIYMAFKGAISQ